MAEKRLDIVIDPNRAVSDARTIKREISEIGTTAVTAQKNVDTLGKTGAAAFDNFQKSGKTAADVVQLNRAQLQNMSYQMNDMATMLASGQSPFVMIMQQGMQIGQMFGPGSTVQGALRATGVGIMSFVTNPINLAIVATAALAGGVNLLFKAFSGGDAQTAEAALERHAEWVDSLDAHYKDAADAAREYQKEAERLPQSAVIAGGRDQLSTLQSNLQRIRNEVGNIAGAFEAAWKPIEGVDERISDAVKKFSTGNSTAREFQTTLADMRLDPNLNDIAELLISQFTDAANEAARLEGGIRGVEAALNRISAVQVNPFGSLLGIGDAVRQINALAPETRTTRQRVEDIFTERAGQARTVGELNSLTEAYRKTTEAITQKERQEKAAAAQRAAITAANAAARKAESDAARAAREAARAYDAQRNAASNMVQNLANQTAMYQAQSEALGMSEQSAVAYLTAKRTILQLTREGKDLLPQEIAAIEDQADALSAATLQYRRQKEAIDFVRSTSKEFFSTMFSGLREGEGFWDSFANAAERALNRIQDKLLDNAFNALLSNVGSSMSAGSSASGLGAFLAKIFHEGGVVGANDNAPSRVVPMSMFQNALRHHGGTGLRADERPVIMQTGEVVLSRQQTAAARNAGARGDAVQMQTNIEIINNNGSQVSVREESDGRGGQRIAITLDEAVAGAVSRPGSRSSRAIAGSFGLGRKVQEL